MTVDPNDSRFNITVDPDYKFELPNASKICVEGLIIGSLFSIVPVILFFVLFSSL